MGALNWCAENPILFVITLFFLALVVENIVSGIVACAKIWRNPK